MAKKERQCLDCLEDRGRDFPASHIAPFFIPKAFRYWDKGRGDFMWPWSKCRGEVRPVCDEHMKLNNEFWIAFTGRDANGNRPE